MSDSTANTPYSDDDSWATDHPGDGLPEDLGEFARENLPHWNEVMAQVDSSRDRIQVWLEYLRTDPSPAEFSEHAENLLEDLRLALGKDGAERPVIDVVAQSGELFEQLDMGQQLYDLLFPLLDDLMESKDQERIKIVFPRIARYHLKHGDPQRAKVTLQILDSLIERDPDVPFMDSMLGEVSIAAMMDSSGDGPTLSAELLSFALKSRARYVMVKAFNTLALYSCYHFDALRTFQYGQLAHFIGLKLGEPVFIINGLHYMAISFTVSPDPGQTNPARAIGLLDRAEAECRACGDLERLPGLRYTRGNAHYLLQQYEQAAEHLTFALNAFPQGTTFHARAAYMVGLSYSRLKRFDEALARLREAYDLWRTLKLPRDQIYAAHALAFTYFQNSQLDEAVTMGQRALDAARQQPGEWWQAYLTVLTADVRKYEQALAVSRA